MAIHKLNYKNDYGHHYTVTIEGKELQVNYIRKIRIGDKDYDVFSRMVSDNTMEHTQSKQYFVNLKIEGLPLRIDIPLSDIIQSNVLVGVHESKKDS
jgi:hypothetical protein